MPFLKVSPAHQVWLLASTLLGPFGSQPTAFALDDSRVIVFPLGSGDYAVAILSDEDALERHRQDIGLPDREAARFDAPGDLLAALDTLPPQVTAVVFDPMRHDRSKQAQIMRYTDIGRFKDDLASQDTSHAAG